MSIRARLIVLISALIVVAFAAVGIVTVSITEERMIDRVDQTLLTTQRAVPRLSGLSRSEPPSNGDRPFFANRATALLLFDSDGEIVRADPSGLVNDPDPLPDVQITDIRGQVGVPFTAGAQDGAETRYRVLVSRLGNRGYLAIAAPLTDVDAAIQNLTAVILIVGLGALVVAIVFIWITIRRALRPIDDMIATAGVIGSGDLSQRVDHQDSATEVGALGRALNDMLAQIETSFAAKEASEQRLRQFVADASHELRTPLTSIRGYAELYRSGAASDPEAVERAMDQIESEGERMAKLVEDLLLLARLDQGRPLRRETVDLVPIVADAVTAARVVEPAREIVVDHPPAAVVSGDADRLRQVIDNLLTNARVHAGPEAAISITVFTTASSVEIAVADDGLGMSPEDASRVFDRFYRADPSRTRARGGTGLGLAIVQSIVRAHDGDVRLDSVPDEGTIVRITLPSTKPQA